MCRGVSCTFQLGGVKYGRKKIKHEYPSSPFTKRIVENDNGNFRPR